MSNPEAQRTRKWISLEQTRSFRRLSNFYSSTRIPTSRLTVESTSTANTVVVREREIIRRSYRKDRCDPSNSANFSFAVRMGLVNKDESRFGRSSKNDLELCPPESRSDSLLSSSAMSTSTAASSVWSERLESCQPSNHAHRYTISARQPTLTSDTDQSRDSCCSIETTNDVLLDDGRVTLSRFSSTTSHIPSTAKGGPPLSIRRHELTRGVSSLSVDSTAMLRSTSSSRCSTSRSTSTRSRYPPSSYRDPFTLAGLPESSNTVAELSEPSFFGGMFSLQFQGSQKDATLSLQQKSCREGFEEDTASPIKSSIPNSGTKKPTTGSTHLNGRHSRSLSQASSTIPKAPTPFPSPESSPLPERASNSSSRSASRMSSVHPTSNVPIPEAAEGRAQISHYTECPHTFPPCARPLNVQPTFAQFGPQLLRYPPFSLRSYLQSDTNGPITPMVSVITGSCPSCDLTARRQVESSILSRFAGTLRQLENELDFLSSLNDAESPISPPAARRSAAAAAADMRASIKTVSDKITQLRAKQDSEVKRVWRGYTKRWGPGTIGIYHREKHEDTTAISERSDMKMTKNKTTTTTAAATTTTNYVNSSSSVDGIVDEGRMRVDWIRPDLPG